MSSHAHDAPRSEPHQRSTAVAGRSNGSPRKVLMLAHAFPPTGGPGVQRPAKFAKYLPEFGWNPIVWSADRIIGLPRDETLADDLPEGVTVHVRSQGGVQAVRRTLRGFRDALENGASPGVTGLRGVLPVAAAATFAAGLDWRIAAWCNAHGFPDDCAGWARRSVRPLTELIRREHVDLIYSTYSPASNHVLAMELKRRTRIPWVAEFRDLWIDDGRYRPDSPRVRAAHMRLQQEILELADAVIGVTPRQTAILSDYVPSQRGKFRTITNGFDPDDFAASVTPDDAASRGGSTFVLAHVGRFDSVRTPDELFTALRALSEQLASQRSRFRVRIVGHANAAVREKLEATGLACEFVGYVSHGEAIRAMRDADALLLPVPHAHNSDTIICGKLFEYLASGRPIVVVGPRDGECERIVRSCRAGLAAPFESERILAVLQDVFDAWRSGRPLSGCPADVLDQYARPELTRRLARIFDRLADTMTPADAASNKRGEAALAGECAGAPAGVP